MPNFRSEERRQSKVMYASRAHSIPNLKVQATEILQRKVDSGDLDEMTPIPSDEWICLQFIPNCAESKVAEKIT